MSKRRYLAAFVILTLVSLNGFSAPRSGGSGRTGGGSPSPSGKHSPSPSSSNGARASNTARPASTPSGPAPSGNRQPAPPSSAPSQERGQAPSAPGGNSSGGSRGTGSAADQEILYYRGSRLVSNTGSFLLQKIKSQRMSSSEISVEITFNKSVNPLTLTSNSIIVNGDAISEKTRFAFNKKGDTIKVSVPTDKEVFSLKIQNMESFDGTTIEPIEVTDIIIGG